MLLSRKRSISWRTLAAIAPILIFFVIVAGESADSHSTVSSAQDQSTERMARICGYDPAGAESEWLKHQSRRARGGRSGGSTAADLARLSPEGPKVEDVGDVAVISDDGSIVLPPNKFDLKKRSLLFTPDGDSYRIERGKIDFEKEIGFKLGYFFGIEGTPAEADNGYRELALRNAFPFFGLGYDRIFVGTNGYITFTQGDIGALPSASAFSSQLPRIAPLWADLDPSAAGGIYFSELPGRTVITWQAVGQAQFPGLSTFQVVLHDDGRIAMIYKKVAARSSLIGISPGVSGRELQLLDLSQPPEDSAPGGVYEMFSTRKRLDIPALTQAFYRDYPDSFDFIYIWTDFEFDNGIGLAHAFNVRNHIQGIGLSIFDRGSIYGSAERLSTVITMGQASDWPSDPDARAAGLFSGISIVCHELGHRWLAYVRFDADNDIKDDLLGRDSSHWSFLADSRTNAEGSFSSVMEGNAWRDRGDGVFTSIQSSANYFSALDQYLMGLREADEVGEINYLVVNDPSKYYLRVGTPESNFSVGAVRMQAAVDQITDREGPRIPDAANSPREFRVAFILLTEQRAGSATIDTVNRYRRSLERYFSVATNRRATLDAAL